MMSALGQKQTWLTVLVMSALPPKADIVYDGGNVCFVPLGDIEPFALGLRTAAT